MMESNDALSPGDAPEAALQPHRRSRRWWLLGIPVVVAAVVAATGLTTSSSANAETTVVDAASSSLQQQTGAFTLTGSFEVGPMSLSFNGTGKFDLANDAASMDLSASGLPGLGGLGLSTIVTGGTAYEGGAAFAGRLADGKSWIGLPYSQFVSSSSAGAQSAASSLSSPGGVLAILSQQGSTVTDLGAGSIDGVSVERYKVVPSVSDLRQRLEQSSLPAAAKSQAEAMFSQGDLAFVVSIDGSQRLKQISWDLSTSILGTSVVTHLVETITSWGGSVDIVAPSPSSVCSATPTSISSCLSLSGLGSSAI